MNGFKICVGVVWYWLEFIKNIDDFILNYRDNSRVGFLFYFLYIKIIMVWFKSF